MNDGGPAFPGLKIVKDGELMVANPDGGMTLRDYFAAQVITAVSNYATEDSGHPESWDWESLAEVAYTAADAMIAARKQGK